MNIPYLSYKSIVSRPLSSFLSWLLLAFGVSVVVLILLVSDQLKKEISKNAQGIDLVVGAKGSPLQIILSNIFHIDFPTGNIDLKDAAALSKNRYIANAIPLSLGDSYYGFRIVGTTRAYGELYDAALKEGKWFEEEMEAVVGTEVVKELGLSIGDKFESQHGLSEEGDAHGGQPFVVTGILEQSSTVLDRLILTTVPSIWAVHDHEEEEEHHHQEDSLVSLDQLGIQVTADQLENEQVTSVLIKYGSPMGAVMLPRAINAKSNLQAASPAYEMARLFNIIGVGVRVLNMLGVLIIVISGVSVFIALLNSLKDRKYEIAIMRSMGATKTQIFMHILIEGLMITFVGAISGLIIAHLLIVLLTSFLEGINPDAVYFVNTEWIVLLGSLIIGTFASIIPSVLAYKTDISKTLARG